MEKLIKVAINDFRLVFRDNSLKVFLFLPLMNVVVIRYVFPYLASIYGGLTEYFNIILMLASTQGATAFGFIYSMVLVDEKDTNVAKVYGILPVSKVWFVIFRLIPPFILASLATFLLLLVEPFFGLPVISNLIYSMLAGLLAPLMILFIATVSKNKIEAMTWQKLFNILIILPVLAFFVPNSFSYLFAVVPNFWAFQALQSVINGHNLELFLPIGFVYTILVIAFLLKKFTANHFK